MIPAFRPALYPKDFAYVRRLCATGWVAPGPLAAELEQRASRLLGTRHGCATSSGTAALHLALLAVGTRPGDRVLVPSFACAALANAVRHAGAEPVFMDVDPGTLNPDPDLAKAALRRGTRALVLTHTSGYPVAVAPFRRLGLAIIEDCCLAAGSSVDGKPVGSWGDAAILSFAATKPATGGQGGMVCTSDSRLAAKVRDLNRYDNREDYKVRFNYQMSDLCAGLALAQWKRLPAFLRRRRRLARLYLDAFTPAAPLGAFPRIAPDAEPNFHNLVLLVRDADRFIAASQRAGVACQRIVYKPLHRYRGAGLGGRLPGTDEAFRRSVGVPIHPALSDAQARRVRATVRTLLEKLA